MAIGGNVKPHNKSCKRDGKPPLRDTCDKATLNKRLEPLMPRVTRSQAKHLQETTALAASLKQRSISCGSCKDEDNVPSPRVASARFDITGSSKDSSVPLPLTREALQVFNQSNQIDTSPPTESEIPTSAMSASDPSEASINAYHVDFKSSLKQRNAFFFNGPPENLPVDLDELKKAVFSETSTSNTNDEDAAFIRRIVHDCTNEGEMLTGVLPQVVSLTRLQSDPTVTYVQNKGWRRCLVLDPDLKPFLTPPKPDITIGWTSEVFPFKKASRNLGSFQHPVNGNTELAWPLFTIEVKGEQGNLRVARLQNLHNAAVMLANLLEIRKAARKEHEFYNRVHVMSLELTTESFQLSYYWATRSAAGEVSYYGKALQTWTPLEESGDSYKRACRCIRNAIDLIRTRAFPLIYSDMAIVDKLYDKKTIAQVPSPRSFASQYGVRKRRAAKTKTAKTGASTIEASSLYKVTSDASQLDGA